MHWSNGLTIYVFDTSTPSGVELWKKFVFYNAKRESAEDTGDTKACLDSLYDQFPESLLSADAVQGWLCLNFVTISSWQDVRAVPDNVLQLALLTEAAVARFDSMQKKIYAITP
ncbi:hypothetical protein HDU76_002268 [Blyttiomyces sp. JEL0837]|nr:hypothetical protein HDU76_002268 [Blyttiomyces sp. JEL0837]